MAENAWCFTMCLGQASNPGPVDSRIKLAVANPTAVFAKVDRLLGLEADILAGPETSATSVVQKDCTREFSKAGFKSFWSKVVAPKKSTLDNRPSYRGEAVGSAILSSLPCRTDRCGIHLSSWETRRFSSSIVRLAGFEILVISLYGFAKRHKEGIRPNDILIASIIPIIVQGGLPFIVAGGFNEPLTKFDFLFLTPPKFRKFHVTALGNVPGEQAVARAEFFAILHAAWQVSMCEPIPRTEFVTDASYACHVIKIVESGSFQHVLHKFSKTVKGLVLRPFCCDKSQESQSF